MLRHWTLLHFKCLYCALECDMLHNKALVEKVTVASGAMTSLLTQGLHERLGHTSEASGLPHRMQWSLRS